MDRPVQSSDGIPLPRFRTMLLVAALALGAWIVWSIADTVRARHALMNPSAPTLQRVQAVNRWASLGRQALPDLTEALKADDAKTRELALLALAQIGPDARETGADVVQLLDDPAHTVRGAALHALKEIGHPLEQESPAIVAFLSAEDASLREDAAGVLEKIGAPVIRLLCNVVESPKPDARVHAVALLGRLGEGNPAAVAAIHRAAVDPDDRVRGLAYRILIFWNELTLDEAIAGLRDVDPQIASNVARSAERVGEDAAVLVPDLVRLLGREDTEHSALTGLWALGAAAKSAVPEVLPLLESKARPELVLDVLGRIGAGQADLVPHVRPFLVERSPYGYASERAGEALARISPEAARAAVPEVVQHLRGEDSQKRGLAAAALNGFGPEARDAVVALIEALTDPTDWVRLYAAKTLGAIGPPAAAALPELVKLARDRSLSREDRRGSVTWQLRNSATRGLGLIRAEPDMVVPVLVGVLREEDEAVRAEAALALGRLRTAPKTAVPVLESVLLDDSILARKAAAIALGHYGPHARSAVQILVGMADEDGELPPVGWVASPPDEPFRLESKWQESYQNSFPLAPLYRRSEASFAAEALQRIDPDALRKFGIEAWSR